MIKTLLLITSILLFNINTTYSMSNNEFIDKFYETYKIIGCINTKTFEIKQPNKNGNCYIGKNYQNIIIPPKSHIEKYFEVYDNYNDILKSMPTENVESGFNENAENGHAKGYVQTLKSYNIPGDIVSQLTWKKNRQDSQLNNKNQCGYYEKGSVEQQKCIYRYHYHSRKGYKYAEKSYKLYEYYKKYFGI